MAQGKYVAADELPADNWFPTQKILRIKDVPEHWDAGTTLQMTVHRQGGDRPNANSHPIAFTQGTITPRRMVNGALILLAPTKAEQLKKWKRLPNRLPAGNYMVKVYADAQGKLEADPTAFLDESDLVGQLPVKNAKWLIGFPKAQTISGKPLANK